MSVPITSILAHTAAFVLGLAIVLATISSAIRTFVLPRGVPDLLTSLVFSSMRAIFELSLAGTPSYARRDRVMASFAPYIPQGLEV